MSGKAHGDSRTELSHKDVQIYVRQLVATTIEEQWKSGKFDEDIAYFNENAQMRIRGELRNLIRSFHSSDSEMLPRHSKPGRPKKGQENVKSN